MVQKKVNTQNLFYFEPRAARLAPRESQKANALPQFLTFTKSPTIDLTLTFLGLHYRYNS